MQCFDSPFLFKVGPDIQVLPASLKDVICPDLLKMTSDDITRGGVIPSPNSTKNTKGSKSVSNENFFLCIHIVSRVMNANFQYFFSSVKKEENQDILPLDICLYFFNILVLYKLLRILL